MRRVFSSLNLARRPSILLHQLFFINASRPKCQRESPPLPLSGRIRKNHSTTSLVAVKIPERNGHGRRKRVQLFCLTDVEKGKKVKKLRTKTHPSLTLLPQLSSASLIALSSWAGHLTSWLEWDAERVMRRLRAGGDAAAAFASVPLP